MITIEPVMDFDIKEFLEMLVFIKPDYINIGADSKGHKLPEPPREKLLEFLSELKKVGLNVLEKKNLKRLLREVGDE